MKGFVEKTYRGDSMRILTKPGTRDITRVVFDHPIWQTDWGDTVPDMPFDVQVELTNTCQLACHDCTYCDDRRPKRRLPWEVLRRLADEAASESVAYFTICGIGEATLHPDLFRFLAYVRALDVEPCGYRVLPMIPTVLISNGCWTDRHIEQCIESPPDLVSFSLAGIDRAEIEERRRPLDFDRFVHVVSEVFARRRVVRDVDGGVSPVIHVSTHIPPEDMRSRQGEMEEFIETFAGISDGIVFKPTMLDRPWVGRSRTSPCFETSRRLSITATGDVWCGHHLPERFGPMLGNVSEGSLRGVWHGAAMEEHRLDVRSGLFQRECCLHCDDCRGEHQDPVRVREDACTYE